MNVCPTDRTQDAKSSHERGKERILLRCGLLGPLRITAGASEQTVTASPKIRTVLAMLLVHSDQVVPVPTLMRELWPECPPASALRTLQTYILNSRKQLSLVTGASACRITREVLVTQTGGYVFKNSSGQLDWLEFKHLVGQGKAAIREGQALKGIQILDRGLHLWRGDAFTDVPTGPVLRSRRLLIEESRLDAVQALVEAKIAVGRYQETIADLASLTSEHPFHEGLHAQYMRTLALNGRRVQALKEFSGLRDRLVNEMGIEPGHPLQQLQQTILNSHTDGTHGVAEPSSQAAGLGAGQLAPGGYGSRYPAA